MSGPVVIAKITAQPGKRDELVAGVQALVDNAENEPGTLVYLLYTDAANADVIWFYERYESQEAFDAHSSSETMKAVGMKLRDVAAGRPEVMVLDLVGGKGG